MKNWGILGALTSEVNPWLEELSIVEGIYSTTEPPTPRDKNVTDIVLE